MKPLHLISASLTLIFSLAVQAQNATEIVRKADAKFNGEQSNYSEMDMTIIRPKYQRNLSFKGWATKDGKALTIITAPAKEKGQSFLKSGNNLWSWNPTIQRLIKLPASMMSQGWMGSDFTNDDILKESSLVKDYTHKLLGQESVQGATCYKIELTPLPATAVVWGKLVLWISTDEYLEMKSEFYDEDEYLVKTHLSSAIKSFDNRRLPSVIEIIPAEEPGNKTRVTITAMRFNESYSTDFFTQQNMKRVK